MRLLTIIGQWLMRKRKPAKRGTLSQRIDAARSAGAPAADGARQGAPLRAVPAQVTAELAHSAIRKGFNSTQPVTSARQLHGREEQMEQLIEGVLERHNHALIHGPRGSGKTSLARVFANVADDRGLIVLYTACEPGQSLHQMMSPYLAEVAAADMHQAMLTGRTLEVRDIADMLAAHATRRYLFILDEFDQVADVAVQHELARLMKMLSDAAIPVNIVAVGIGTSLDRMIEGHASLRRHLTPVAVTSIESGAVFALIERGSAATGMPFSDVSGELIALLSCGSPYHVRLFCALSSIEALRARDNIVNLGMAMTGIARAVNDWSRTNSAHAALFRKAIAHWPSHWDALETLAREGACAGAIPMALLTDGFGDAAELLLLLDGVLQPLPGADDRFVFRDSLAPQFLLAMLFACRNSDNADQKIVSIVDPQRQMIVH